MRKSEDPFAGLPLERKVELNAICERFEAACQSEGELPRIEGFLERVSAEERQALAPELIYLDIYYRKQRDEKLSAEQYRQRFPDCSLASLEELMLSADPAQPPAAGQVGDPIESLTAAFPVNEVAVEGDSGPPLPASASIMKALEASLPGVPKVHLREPDEDVVSPVNRPASQEMPAPQAMPERYHLLGEIARGGMGAILKGHDVDLGRDIAVKMMLETHKGKTELLQRFVEEAQINGQLQHPGIVPVYEMGQSGDQRPYFTMKLVKGQTLAALLKGNREWGVGNRESNEQNDPYSLLPIPHSRLLGIFEQICQTMAYAHARGVIHRDLKPANIMVGNFGEVQVMDWGLAKVLAKGGIADEKQPPTEEVSVIRTVRSEGSVSGEERRASGIIAIDQLGAHTQAGSVLGTPAYMAPEQARGEVDDLDERCDVFGLGAILCQILTGAAPYEGKDNSEIHRKAMHADLSEVQQRLEQCGADQEMIALAKRCLQTKKENRPRHAGEVSETVTGYLESVQQRLKQTEIERAEAQTRAVEEQKRREVEQAKAQTERQKRRVTLALAASVLLLVMGGGAAGWWYQQQQAQRYAELVRTEHDIGTALEQAQKMRGALHEKLKKKGGVFKLLNDPAQWQRQIDAAQAAVQRAKDLRDGTKDKIAADLERQLQLLKGQLQKDEAEFKLALHLEKIREDKAVLVEGDFNFASAMGKYRQAFTEAGFRVFSTDVQHAARRIRKSTIREQLVAALDDWAFTSFWSKDRANRGKVRDRLLKLARHVDRDSWSNQIRQSAMSNDLKKLAQFAQQLTKKNGNKQSPLVVAPHSYYILGYRLRNDPLGEKLLRQGQTTYPTDFWLAFRLAAQLDDAKKYNEAAGYNRAALAIRPGSSVVHLNLGVVLLRMRELDGAIIHFKKAIDLHPKYPAAYLNWALALADQGNLEGAVKHFHKAIQLNPRWAQAYTSWGVALHKKDKLDEAIKKFHKAVQLDSTNALAYGYLGRALAQQKKFKDALKYLRKAVQLDSTDAFANRSLGRALAQQKKFKDALKYFQKAIRLDPNNVLDHNILGMLLCDKLHRYQEAQAVFRKAIKLDPTHATSWFNLGKALADQKKFEDAVRHYKKAIALDPEYAPAYNNLGHALQAKGKLDDAIRHFKKAIALDPENASAYSNLGYVLTDKKKFKEAEAACCTAIKIDPQFGRAYSNLGEILAHKNKVKEALKNYQKAILLDPQRASPYNGLGALLCDRLHKYQQAEATFRTAIKIDPQCAMAYSNLGRALARQNQLKEAMKNYQRAIQLDRQCASAYDGMGALLCDRLHKYQEAEAAFRKAIEIDPTDARTWYNLGNALAHQKKHDDAFRHYQKAIQLAPNDAQAYRNLGVVLNDMGKLDEAIAHWQKAIQLDPKDDAAYYNLGLALQMKGKLDESSRHFEKVIQLKPKIAPAYFYLGYALQNQKKLAEAVKHYQKAIQLNPKYAKAHCGLGHTLLDLGRFAEAVKSMQRGHQLGSQQLGWRYPSAKWVERCKKLLDLDQKVQQVLQGKAKAKDAQEQLAFAELCRRYKKQNANAAQFYAAALAGQPELADHLRRYNAARCAALVAAGQGQDAGKLSAKEKAKWRRQALSWLQANLAWRQKQIQSGDPLRIVLIAERTLP